MSGAYYNEIDPAAAQWLRNLIAAGLIAPGEVDERSIEDIRPEEIRGFTQVHFFAGIGVWSYALRRAGWNDTRPVWTGSCPCQPFSAAGKGAGFTDERHLWPAFHYLIEECRPTVVFGEQVASKDADPWIDLVQTDLEAMDYGVGAIAFPSAGIGAPHVRDRLYWVAEGMGNAHNARLEERRRGSDQQSGAQGWQVAQRPAGLSGISGGLADAGRQGVRAEGPGETAGAPAGMQGTHGEWQRLRADIGAGGAALGVWMADASNGGRREECADAGGSDQRDSAQGITAGLVHGGADSRPGPTNGFWRDADWIGCRDGKWRPVEPGTFPLVDGATARVVRLRAYGNAINAQAAEAFIRCVMESQAEMALMNQQKEAA